MFACRWSGCSQKIMSACVTIDQMNGYRISNDTNLEQKNDVVLEFTFIKDVGARF